MPKSKSIIIGLTCCSLVLLTLFKNSSYLLESLANQVFIHQQLPGLLKGLECQWFEGQCFIQQLEMGIASNNIQLEKIHVAWSWMALRQQQLHLKQLTIQKGDIQINTKPESSSSSFDWNQQLENLSMGDFISVLPIQIGIDTFMLHDMSVAFFLHQDQATKTECHVTSLKIQNLKSWDWNSSIQATSQTQCFDGSLTLSAETTLNVPQDPVLFSWNLEQLDIAQVDRTQNVIGKLSTQGSSLVEYSKDSGLSFKIKNTDVHIEDFEVKNLLTLEQLKLGSVSYDQSFLSIDNLQATHFSLTPLFSDPTLPKTPARFKELQMQKVRLEDESFLKINHVLVTGAQLPITFLKNEQIALTEWVVNEVQTRFSSSTTKPSTQEAPPLAVTVDQIQLKESAIIIDDFRISPKVHIELNPVELELGSFSNKEPHPTPLKFEALVNDHGTLKAKGSLSLLDVYHQSDLQLEVKKLNLAFADSYARRFLGYRLKQGVLDGKFHFKSTQQVLDSNADLSLKSLKLEDADMESAFPEFILPLNVSLNLLRSQDDLIELNIPIQGNAKSPEWGSGSIVRTVTWKGIKAAIMNYYTPLGIVSNLYQFIQFATKLRFDDIVFMPNQFELDQTSTKALMPIGKILQEKPELEISICGVATHQDTSSPKDITDLNDMAQARANAVRQYLHESFQIEKDRMRLCSPTIDTDSDAQGRVEISL